MRGESNRGPIKGKVAQASVVELPRSNQANNDTDIGGNFTRRVAMRWTLCVGLASGLTSLSLWNQVDPSTSPVEVRKVRESKRVLAARRREGRYRPFNAPGGLASESLAVFAPAVFCRVIAPDDRIYDLLEVP